MQLNEGKFLQNGKCGYVLKPSFMLKNSPESSILAAEEPVVVVVKVNIVVDNVWYRRFVDTIQFR